MEGYRGLGQTVGVYPQPEVTPYEFNTPVGLGQSQIARGITAAYGGAKAGLQGYGASIADALGANQLAQEWYANANANAQQAELDGPRVRTLGAIQNPNDALDYGLGKVGEFAPYLVGGGALGLVGRGVGAVAGLRGAQLARAGHLTAAGGFQPLMAGEQALALHGDPAAQGMTPQEVLLRSQGVGAAQAYVGAAVPSMMGGQLVTRAEAPTIGRTVGQALSNSVAGGAGMAGMDVIGQMHQSTYDPTHQYNAAQTGERFAGGVAGMLPIAGVHGAITHGLDKGAPLPGKALEATKTEAQRLYEAGKQKAVDLIDVIPDEVKDFLKGTADKVVKMDQDAGAYWDEHLAKEFEAAGDAASVAKAYFVQHAKDLGKELNEARKRGTSVAEIEGILGEAGHSAGEAIDVVRKSLSQIHGDTRIGKMLGTAKEVAGDSSLGDEFARVKGVLDLAKTWEKASDLNKNGLSWLRAGENQMTRERLGEIKKAMSNRAVQAEYANFIRDVLDEAGADNESANELRGYAQRLHDEALGNRTPNDSRTSPLSDAETLKMFTAARVAIETVEAEKRFHRVVSVHSRLAKNISEENPIPEEGVFSKQGAYQSVADAMREAEIDENLVTKIAAHAQDATLLRDGAEATARTVTTKGLAGYYGVEEKEVKTGGFYTPIYNLIKPALEARLAKLREGASSTTEEIRRDEGEVSDTFKQKVGEETRALFATSEVGKNWLSASDGGQGKIDDLTNFVVSLAEQREGFDNFAGMRLMTYLKGAFGAEAEPYVRTLLRELDIEFGGPGKSAQQSARLAAMLEAHNTSRVLAAKIATLLEDSSMDRRPAGGRRKVAPLPASGETVVRTGPAGQGDIHQEGSLTPGSGERFDTYALVDRLLEDFRVALSRDAQGLKIDKAIQDLARRAELETDKNKKNDMNRIVVDAMDNLGDDPAKFGTNKLKKQWVEEGIILPENFEALADLLQQYERAPRLPKAEGGKANHKTSASKTAEIDLDDSEVQQSAADGTPAEGDEVAVKRGDEAGQQGSTEEPARFYGTQGFTHKNGDKYDPLNIGAPVSHHTSGEFKGTESTELGAALDSRFGNGRVGIREAVRMDDWAEEMVNVHGGTPREHLNRALEALLAHDKERLKNEKLDEDSKKFIAARARVADDLRTRSGALVSGAGEEFFAMPMNSPYRYHRLAQHEGGNLAYTRDQLENRYGVTKMDTETWAEKRAKNGAFDAQVYLDSLLQVKDAEGKVMNIDIARLVTSELMQHQDADISGVGDKRMDQGKADEILAALHNVVGAILTAKGIAGKMVDGKFVPNRNALRIKGGSTFESEDASFREHDEPRMYHLHRNLKTGKEEITGTAEREGYELRGSTSATSWLQAKHNLGLELTPMQDEMLTLGLGKENVHFNSDLVVYREQTPVHYQVPGEPESRVQPNMPRFFTLGQLRGIVARGKGGRTTKEVRTNASPGEISGEDLKGIMSTVEQIRRASTKMRDADNNRGIARQGAEKDGLPLNVNLHRILVRMMERNGINVSDALHKEHFPVETAGMLMREAFKELQAQGYSGEVFNLGSEAFDNLVLYTKEYGSGKAGWGIARSVKGEVEENEHPVYWKDVKKVAANPDRNTPRTLEDALNHETLQKMMTADKAEREVRERLARGGYKEGDTSPMLTEKRTENTEKAYQSYDGGVHAPFRDPDLPENELKFSEALQKIGMLVDYRGNKSGEIPLQDKSEAVGGDRNVPRTKGVTESYDERVANVQARRAKTPEQRLVDKAARIRAKAYDYVKSLRDKAMRAAEGDPEMQRFVEETFDMPFLDKTETKLSPEFQAWLDARSAEISARNAADFLKLTEELHGPDWQAKQERLEAAYDKQRVVPVSADVTKALQPFPNERYEPLQETYPPAQTRVQKARQSVDRLVAAEKADEPIVRGPIAEARSTVLRPGFTAPEPQGRHYTNVTSIEAKGSNRNAESRLGPDPSVPEAPAPQKPFKAVEVVADLMNQKPTAKTTKALVESLTPKQLGELLLNLGARPDLGETAAKQVSRLMAGDYYAKQRDAAGVEYNENTMRFVRKLDTPFSKEGGSPDETGVTTEQLDARMKQLLGGMYSAKLVDVVMAGNKETNYAGKFVNKVAEIWKNAPSISGTLHHEVWHAVEGMLKEMGPHGEKILADIHAHVNTPLMKNWLKENYNDAGVESQLDSMSERAAFVFQKLSEGVKMPMVKESKSILQHLADFVRWVGDKVGFKTTTAQERSDNFMDYVMKGDFARDMDNAASVRKGLGEKNGDNIVHQAGQILKPGLEALSAVFQHTGTRVADLKVAEYDTVMELIAGAEGKGGYMNDKRRMEYAFDNEIGNMIKGMSEEQMQKFRSTDTRFSEFQGKIETYMTNAGVEPHQVESFYKRLATLNADAIGTDIEAFITDLVNHGGFKNKAGEARTLANQIADRGFYYDKDRDLFPNRPDLKEKWEERDFAQSVARYIQQAVYLAERTRERPGNDGKMYRMSDLKSLLEAGNAKTDSKGQELMADTLAAYEGTLASDKLSPGLRKFMGSLLFINNVRLLPKAVFSQMLEPMQLALRKGSMTGTLDTLWRGIREMPRTFDKLDAGYTPDKWEKLANQIGTAPSRIIMNVMAQMQNGMTLPGKIGHWNDQFFKLNFMEQWNRSMHIEATKHAVEFLKEHAEIVRTGKNADLVKRSQRYLNELGVKEGDIKVDGDGGLHIDIANVGSDRVARAISQYVNEAMAHPDAGSNPMWMNDPRFALLAQMKRFTFAHSKFVLDRGIKEYKLGNAFPLVPAVLAMPWMLAADGLRDTITMTDTSYKNNWGIMDHMEHAWARSGNAGRGQFFGDMEQSIRHGGSGVEGFAGPTAELFGRFARGMHTGQWFDSMVNQVPGAQVIMPD